MSSIATSAAPSAAPAGTPGTNVPASSPAPSAPATPTKVLTLTDYDQLASASIQAASVPPSESNVNPAPSVPPGSEPTPAPATPTAPSEPAPPAAVQPSGSGEEDPEPSAEVLASLSDPGRRALQAEREAKKAAKAEAKELKARLAELEAKLNPAPAVPVEPQAPAVPSAPTPGVATPALADCHTFEAVEARGLVAAQTEAQVLELQNTLAYQGAEATAAALAQMGVEKIGATPVAEATAEVLAGFLARTLAGTRLTQLQVEPRKRFITQESQSYQQAVRVLPELADPKSPACRQIAAFLDSNPQVRSNPNWPMLVTKLWLGEQAMTRTQTAPAPAPAPAPAKPAAIAPAPATIPAPVVPALNPAPGAPAISTAALPTGSRMAELAAKLQNGTASLADIDEYGKLSVTI